MVGPLVYPVSEQLTGAKFWLFYNLEIPNYGFQEVRDMAETKPLTKLVRPLSKGQITLPVEFRRRLRIDDRTILSLTLKGSKIEILPLRPLAENEPLKEYSKDEIERFVKEDRLDRKTAKKVRKLLGRSV